MNIVVGYDGSDAANAALNVAKKHAKAFDGKIYMITSLVGGTQEKAEEIIKTRDRLEKAAKSIRLEGIPCEEHLLIRGLEPGEDIVKFAEDHQADEIVIGVIKKSKVQKFLLGSNAQYVILHSPCMVVAVK
ncbi:MAG: universal stress protein [Deltaproteobacteria bacterium]|nr:universal stress protein [Deltaproteobacteria bacterium]